MWRSPASVGGIVPAQDIDAVNSTNIGSYAIPYRSSVAGSETYTALTGNYYYVAFASSQPNTRIIIASSGTAAVGLLVLTGFACVVIGIVVAIVGALQNRSHKPAKTYEYKYPEKA